MNRHTVRRRVAASPLATLAAYAVRAPILARHLMSQFKYGGRWLLRSRETTNLNYALTPLNRLHLAWWVAGVSERPVKEILTYFEELESDSALGEHVHVETEKSRYRRVSDEQADYGRRLGWYALVRALRPAHVVETGIDKGLGTCVLAAAVMRNGAGRVTAVDVTPDAGWLVSGPYAVVVDILCGDAATVIRSLTTPVDLLIHDVHYLPEQERDEYEAALPKLSARGMLVSDNAHAYAVLPDLAARLGWQFSYFQERPRDHWYPGAGLGAAWPARTTCQHVVSAEQVQNPPRNTHRYGS